MRTKAACYDQIKKVVWRHIKRHAEAVQDGGFIRVSGPQSLQTLLNIVHLANTHEEEDHAVALQLLGKYEMGQFVDTMDSLQFLARTGPELPATVAEAVLASADATETIKKRSREDPFYQQPAVEIKDVEYFAKCKRVQGWEMCDKYEDKEKDTPCAICGSGVDPQTLIQEFALMCWSCSDYVAACSQCHAWNNDIHVCAWEGCGRARCSSCAARTPFATCPKCLKLWCDPHMPLHECK